MPIKKVVRRFTAPIEELDREELREFCSALGTQPMDTLEPRTRARVGGEIRSVRIVPRAGAPALEVTVDDGRASITGVFLGRRKIAGLSPGRRVTMEGVVARTGNRTVMVNPVYTLLA